MDKSEEDVERTELDVVEESAVVVVVEDVVDESVVLVDVWDWTAVLAEVVEVSSAEDC